MHCPLNQDIPSNRYAAFGNSINSNILLQFDKPKFLIDIANALVLCHMIPAYQVRILAQPLR